MAANTNPGLIKRGILITKTLIFKALISKAGTIVLKPYRLINLGKRAIKKAKGYNSIGELSSDIRNNVTLLVHMINAWARGEYKGVSRKNIMLIIASVLYFIMPFDVIPDFIPMMGYLDDASILIWVFNTLSNEIREFAAWKIGRGDLEDLSYEELYDMARQNDLDGRSKMNKSELMAALAVQS